MGTISGRVSAAREIDAAVEAANLAVTDLPDWNPGRSIEELIGSQIITLTNAAISLRTGEQTGEDLAIAREVDALGEEQLTSGRYGFSC